LHFGSHRQSDSNLSFSSASALNCLSISLQVRKIGHLRRQSSPTRNSCFIRTGHQTKSNSHNQSGNKPAKRSRFLASFGSLHTDDIIVEFNGECICNLTSQRDYSFTTSGNNIVEQLSGSARGSHMRDESVATWAGLRTSAKIFLFVTLVVSEHRGKM